MILISDSLILVTSNSGCLQGPSCFFQFAVLLASRKPITSVEFKIVASAVIRAAKLKFVAEVELESTLCNMLPPLATLNFVARQVGHKRGNTRNRGFQQCCETS